MFTPDTVTRLLAATVLVLVVSPLAFAQTVPRRMPAPLPGHPGNVYLADEEVSVPAAAGAVAWQVTDADGKPVGNGKGGEERIRLGRLPIGWYRVDWLDAQGKRAGWTTAAVIAPAVGPTPQDSPVCVDSATSWFSRRYKGEEAATQEAFANLAALAGVNWIRDRLAWGHMEPKRGVFAEETIYDTAATLEAKHGLNVLQVFHSTPGWAIDKGLDGRAAWKRFPRDLRTAYAFCRAMAKRFGRRTPAWEPWNEANIEPFGGHTIDEMCAMQKASYFGLKAGAPDVTVCWNVYAGSGSPLHAEGVLANEAWPYFETYNIHSYSRPDQYLRQFATARQAACGRPIWITECGIRLRTTDEPPWGDLSPEDERRQAAFVAKSYASSLFAGVDRHFFFILGNYIERGVQFGLLRHDLTPRPGYVALAAVGRFLAGATCLGRLSPTVYAFRAKPDGVERDVLVAWSGEGGGALPGGPPIDAVHDYLGRPLGKRLPSGLPSTAVFALLPAGATQKLKLEAPPEIAPSRPGTPCPVVLQVSLPHQTTRLGSQAHEVVPGEKTELPLFLYNFGDRPVTGTVAVQEAPENWHVHVAAEPVRLAPLDRKRLTASVAMPAGGRELLSGGWVKLRGDFNEAGTPVLAFRLAVDLTKLKPTQVRAIPAGDRADSWQDNIVGKGKMSHRAAQPTGVAFDMQFADTDPWAYPRLRLRDEDAPPNDFDGLTLVVQVLEGTGTVRVQLVEASGSAYLAEAGVNADSREPQRAVVLFRHCRWGAHSEPDPDGKLKPADIRSILVGINSRRDSTVKMVVGGLEWVKF